MAISLCSRRTLPYLASSSPGSIAQYKGGSDTFRFLIEVYLFADRRGALRFQNIVIGELNSQWPTNPRKVFDVLNLAFTETIDDSNLRRLLIDRFAWDAQLETLQNCADKEDIHPAFALGIFAALVGRMQFGWHPPSYRKCPSGSEHNFRCNQAYCGQSPELVLRRTAGTYLQDSDKAPYRHKFCETYHEHKQGESCHSP